MLGEIDKGCRVAREEEVPLALDAFPLKFIPKQVLHLFHTFRFAGDLREGVGSRIAAGSQHLGRNDEAGTRI